MQTNRQIVYDHWKPNFCIHKLVDKVFYPRILSEPPLNQGGYDIEDDKNNFMKDAEYILYGGVTSKNFAYHFKYSFQRNRNL